MNNPRVLALITIVFWSFTAYLTRSISMRSQVALLIVSMSCSFITMAIYFTLLRPRPASGRFTRVRLEYVLFGPLGYFVYAVALFQSYRAFNSASQTTVLNYTWPLFTVVFAEALFRQRAKRTVLQGAVEGLGITVGFLSVLVLGTEGRLATLDFSNIPGVAWGLLAGASYGMFSAYSTTVSGEAQGTFLLTAVFLSVMLVALTATATSEIGLLRTLTLRDVIYPAAWGCVGNGIGYITWTRANRLAREQEIGVSAVASAMFVLPLLALTMVALLLKETQLFHSYFALSVALILLSSVLCQKAGSIAGWLSRRWSFTPGSLEH